EEILRFFTLVSSVIAIQERRPVCPHTTNDMEKLVSEIKYLNLKHRIISILSGINLAIDYTERKLNNKNVYYLLILDYKSQEVRIRSFKSTQLEVATNAYDKIESETNKNVVLVAAKSFNELREAYPNYFVDISGFITMVKKIIRNE
ncbi:MAG: hypothetical protein HDR07_05480, partial [Lachnospiraceae bacterium]|nr:hypothetical protein [Lachnospiraceae bacterium]